MKLPAHVLFRKELSLLVWKPHGILDQALVNEILALRRVYAPLLAEGKSDERQVDRAGAEARRVMKRSTAESTLL